MFKEPTGCNRSLHLSKILPKVIIWNKLVSTCSDEEIIDKNANEEIHEQKCEKDDEKCVEESVVNDLIDL